MCSLANGTLAQILFTVLLICEIGGNNYEILFYVLPSLEKDLILGITFIKVFRVIIDFVSGIVTISQYLTGHLGTIEIKLALVWRQWVK